MTRNIPLDPAKLKPTRGGSAILRVSINNSPNTSTQNNSNPRDDTRLIGLPLRQQIKIGIIDSFQSIPDSAIHPSRWLKAVLKADQTLVSVQQINATAAADRIDPTLDILFILSPSALDDQSWERIKQLNTNGTPIIITPDPSPDTLAWSSKIQTLAPGLIKDPLQIKGFDPPIGLSTTLNPNDQIQSTLLAGIQNEYPDLASSVKIFQTLNPSPGDQARILLRDSNNQPIALVTTDSQSNAGAVALIGIAFDVQWTDLPARPLFVAIIHELVRSLLARSIAPDTRLAGTDSKTLVFASLKPILNKATTVSDPRFSNAFVRVDDRGTSLRPVIINPDTRRTALPPSELESPLAAAKRAFQSIPITDLSGTPDISKPNDIQRSDPARSIALTLFMIAAILAILELLLARRCSYRPPAHSIDQRSTA